MADEFSEMLHVSISTFPACTLNCLFHFIVYEILGVCEFYLRSSFIYDFSHYQIYSMIFSNCHRKRCKRCARRSKCPAAVSMLLNCPSNNAWKRLSSTINSSAMYTDSDFQLLFGWLVNLVPWQALIMIESLHRRLGRLF